MAEFLIASAVLTIVLNVGLRLVPGLQERLGRWLRSMSRPSFPSGAAGDDRQQRPRVQVFVPWKAMLVASIGLTVLANLVILLR